MIDPFRGMGTMLLKLNCWTDLVNKLEVLKNGGFILSTIHIELVTHWASIHHKYDVDDTTLVL